MEVSSGKPQRPPPPQRVQSEPVNLAGEFPVVVPPLQPQQIRWFYCEPGKFWQPFCGGDSMTLEEARCCLDSIDSESVEVEVMGNMYIVEVFKKEATLRPIYWTMSKPWPVIRGSWFELSGDSWYPLPEHEADIIEEAHTRRDWRERAKLDNELSSWAHSRPGVERRGSQGQVVVILHQVSVNGYETVWIGENEVLKVKKDISSRLWSKVGEKLGKGQLYGSTRLVRGYREPSLRDDLCPPIGHLVFVVHGIGQNMEGSDIIKSTSDLRQTCTRVAKKHFPNEWNKKRVEFIPIEWRTWLSLDKGTLSSITPHGVKTLRNLLNDSLLDVMYYMSPRYGPEILDGLHWQLHKKYKEFVHRHPKFVSEGGTVSIFAHSLGSVMCFDLMHETCRVKGLLKDHVQDLNVEREGGGLEKMDVESTQDDKDMTDSLCTSQTTLDNEFDELQRLRIRVAELESRLGASHTEEKILKFNVDHFFAVGSPLGIFIVLREHGSLIKRDHKGAGSFLPSCVCRRIHNLHHPSDPVAYRMEPLINPLYSQIKPVKIDSAGSKPSQKSKELAEGPRQDPETQGASRGSWWNTLLSTSVLRTLNVSGNTSEGSTKPLPTDKLLEDDSKLSPDDRLKERLDFMLREGLTENSYINSLTAHLCYWTSNDCAMYLLLQMYSYQK